MTSIVPTVRGKCPAGSNIRIVTPSGIFCYVGWGGGGGGGGGAKS